MKFGTKSNGCLIDKLQLYIVSFCLSVRKIKSSFTVVAKIARAGIKR